MGLLFEKRNSNWEQYGREII